MPYHGQLSSDSDVHGGGKEALRGAVHGAALWGIPCLVAAVAAYSFLPAYRNLTFQFKMYLQLSGMTVGSCIEGERRLREFEDRARRIRKIKRDQEAWRRFEEDYEDAVASQKKD